MSVYDIIQAYWDPETGDLGPPHEVGLDEHGERLYQLGEGWEPVSAYWLDEDGLAHPESSTAVPRTFRAAVIGGINLTTEEKAHLSVEELLDAAMEEARVAGVEHDTRREDLRIVPFTVV